MEGKADPLGGGVWKKRLNDNMDRAIIAAKGEKNWIFMFLFMKKDRENIDKAEEAERVNDFETPY
ncbi:Putative cytoplasmic protein [Janthinobacterium sp. CG23_2]|nr:Putative cytoplasmic protein [Janthinobacterium sp. CG23_2]CUU30668.1 Putative cytoplasmic protein [Janthinobacterium sp. CG23_2]